MTAALTGLGAAIVAALIVFGAVAIIRILLRP